MTKAIATSLVRTGGLLSIALLLSLVTQSALASDRSMRCGVHMIYAGGNVDSTRMYEVVKKCGEPVLRHGNTWIYLQGSVRRELTFNHDNRLKRIDSFRS